MEALPAPQTLIAILAASGNHHEGMFGRAEQPLADRQNLRERQWLRRLPDDLCQTVAPLSWLKSAPNGPE
jgi:hypothetical protein